MREGSGLFVTDSGHIATSAALIADADYVVVWTSDGQRWKANVIGTDPISDVAVVHIESDAWQSLSIASSAIPISGQQAFALDHQANAIIPGSVTDASTPMIAISQRAALPGSALVNAEGTVIAMAVTDGTTAAPAWLLERVIIDLIADGSAEHQWLGIAVESAQGAKAVVVVDVIDDSPASAAGVRVGDIIDSVNGETVTDGASIHRTIQTIEAGGDAVLTLSRNGSRRLVVVTPEIQS